MNAYLIMKNYCKFLREHKCKEVCSTYTINSTFLDGNEETLVLRFCGFAVGKVSGYWILDTGYWMLDAGCWMLEYQEQKYSYFISLEI